jgi:hypothetical protein
MKTISIRNLVLVNIVFSVLLLLASAIYFWASSNANRIAAEHSGTPDLVPNAFYEQRMYDKLRDTAVSCNRSQDELFVASMRSSAKYAGETAGVLIGLSVLLLLNAWGFNTVAHRDATTASQ